MHLYRSVPKVSSKIKVKNLEGVTEEVELSEITLAGFNIDVNKEVTQPNKFPVLGDLPSTVCYPDTSYIWIFKGAFFTPDTVITISGCTVTYQEFISDNEIEVRFTSGPVSVNDISINNGTMVTFYNRLETFLGTVTFVDESNVLSMINATAHNGVMRELGVGVVEIGTILFGTKSMYMERESYSGVYGFPYGAIQLWDSSGLRLDAKVNRPGGGVQAFVDGVKLRDFSQSSNQTEFAHAVLITAAGDVYFHTEIAQNFMFNTQENLTLKRTFDGTRPDEYVFDSRVKIWD